MDASIELLGISSPGLGTQSTDAPSSTVLKVHCRIAVAGDRDCEKPFDTVTLSLQGVIKSEIGTIFSVQRIVDVTKQQEWSHFQQSEFTKNGTSWRGFADVQLSVSVESDINSREGCGILIPSMRLSGSTFITKSTVLSDQYLVAGNCNVMYWITAQFRQGGLVVKQVDHPIEITILSTALQLKVSASSATEHIECVAIPRSWSMIRRGWPLRARKSSRPTLTFRASPNLGVISMQGEKKAKRAQFVTIPLAMCLTLPPNLTIDQCEVDTLQDGLAGGEVTAKWYTRKVFTTRSLSLPFADGQSRARISRNTVVEQRAVLSFPPLYLDSDPISRAPTDAAARPVVYSATESLQLLLPETITSPSVHTDLLRIFYELELFISFKPLEKNSLNLGPCTARMKVPLAVQLA